MIMVKNVAAYKLDWLRTCCHFLLLYIDDLLFGTTELS